MHRLFPLIGFTIILCGIAFQACTGIRSGSTPKETYATPPEIRSTNGVLDVSLQASIANVLIGGTNSPLRVYNGLYIPPTLRVWPGDTINLTITNDIDEVTNIHYHGMNVSPRGSSDNVWIRVGTNSSYFRYTLKIPTNHPSGLFWYHPHAMGTTEFQTMNGMSGALIVEGILDPFPNLQGIKERLLLLKDIQRDRSGLIVTNIDSGAPTLRTVNGSTNVMMLTFPGEMEFWRVGNIGADIYYNLQLDGHVLYEVARDGNRHNQLWPVKNILLPPSSRVEFLIESLDRGLSAFRTRQFSTGPAGDVYPDATLGYVLCGGPTFPRRTLPVNFPPVLDLRTQVIATNRTLTFSESADGNTFFINGKRADMNRIDTVVPFGHVEEWTILNTAQEMHVFHIHQLDFQVTEINGVQQPFIGRQDTVNMPFAYNTNSPSVVKVLIPFTEPQNIGKFVYHCHIMNHEDNGMMAVILVTTNLEADLKVNALDPLCAPATLKQAGSMQRVRGK